MHKYGLKLWSTNSSFIKPALKLWKAGHIGYLELYVVPGSAKEYLDVWKSLECPYYLHAPHYYSGFNFSIEKCEVDNRSLLDEVEAYRTALNANRVIFHPGVNGSPDETIRQVKIFKNEFPELFNRALMENKPTIGLQGERCVGASPEEMSRILSETGAGFCFDIGHALCYAAWSKIEWNHIFDTFMELNPALFHLSDGDLDSPTDSHLHLGEGNYHFQPIFNKLPCDALISIETNKNHDDNLERFTGDILFCRELMDAKVSVTRNANAGSLRLRKVAVEDMDAIFEWRNHPVCRNNSFNPDPILWDEHARWFRQKLADTGTVSYIGLSGNERIGVIRFDEKESMIKVSIMVNPVFINQGLGKRLIRSGTEKYLEDMKIEKTMVAEIKKDNMASIKAFLKAGYEIDDGVNTPRLAINII